MRSFRASLAVLVLVWCGVVSAGSAATGDVPGAPATPDPSSSGDLLPTIGRTRAVTTFCRRIVDDGSALAAGQLDDIATTTQALRILALTPFDRSIFVQRRATLALETLSARLMSSRKGAAKTYVADLRKAAKNVPATGIQPDRKHFDAMPVDPARVDLDRFAAALDGAHAESSHVAHEISRAVSTLGAVDTSDRTAYPPDMTTYMPDRSMFEDPRLARALRMVVAPVEPDIQRALSERTVENGPLHLFARAMAIELGESLERMLGSVEEARQLFPTAYVGCTDVDERPQSAPSSAPTGEPATTPSSSRGR